MDTKPSEQNEEKINQIIVLFNEARIAIDNQFQYTVKFLIVSEDLIDPTGINMALIGDRMLNAGYFPDEFE